VKLGDKAMVDAPYGRYSFLNFPNEENTVLISGGVGITPALSMLRYMRKKEKVKREG
jgi:ferredoxin-NADP reductase